MKNILYFASNLDFNLSNGASILDYEQIKLLNQNSNLKVINCIENKNLLGQKIDLKVDYQEIDLKKNIFGLTEYPKTVTGISINPDYVVFTSSPQVTLINQFKSSKKIYIINNTDYQQNKQAFLNINNQEELLCSKSDVNIFLSQKDFLYFKTLKLVRKNDTVIPPFIFNNHLIDNTKTENQALITTNLENIHNKESLMWFLKDVYPSINPNIKLVISGKGDFEGLKEYYPRIKFTGFLDRHELINLYNQSSLFINPTISGSGVQIKLLEALSYNMKVVSTNYTNTFPHIIKSSNEAGEFAKIINENISSSKQSFNFEEYNKINSKSFLKIFDIKDIDN